MCPRTEELALLNDPVCRGKRLRVHEYVTHAVPLEITDLADTEVIRLLGAYEVDALTLALQGVSPR